MIYDPIPFVELVQKILVGNYQGCGVGTRGFWVESESDS